MKISTKISEPPDKYLEQEGYDIRIAILKTVYLQEAIGQARISLFYSNKEEYRNDVEEREAYILRSMHLRHAILDLNNSFDILLQVPWFLYRMWEEFNSTGSLYRPKRNKRNRRVVNQDIIRNSEGWVLRASRSCNYGNMERYHERYKQHEFALIFEQLIRFNKEYIYNDNKNFTVRMLANTIKHIGNLELLELNNPTKFSMNLNTNYGFIHLDEEDLNRRNLAVELPQEFLITTVDGKTRKGIIKHYYNSDMYVNIDYYGGESFRGKDIVRRDISYSIEDVYNECSDYLESIEEIYNQIAEFLDDNKYLTKISKQDTKVRQSNDIHLDKYLKSTPPTT